MHNLTAIVPDTLDRVKFHVTAQVREVLISRREKDRWGDGGATIGVGTRFAPPT